jgi:hypothetical protein
MADMIQQKETNKDIPNNPKILVRLAEILAE